MVKNIIKKNQRRHCPTSATEVIFNDLAMT